MLVVGTFRDFLIRVVLVKDEGGAGQQQLRHVDANAGAWPLNLCVHAGGVVDDLVDRSASPWDCAWRRPSHADRKKALARAMVRADLKAASSGPGPTAKLNALAQRLLAMAA